MGEFCAEGWRGYFTMTTEQPVLLEPWGLVRACGLAQGPDGSSMGGLVG